MTVINVPMLERFEVNDVSGCWLWLGYKDANGYARAGEVNAHVAVFKDRGGVIPAGFDLDHLCKRRDCVNPDHMEAVPELENILRKSRTVSYLGRKFDICRKGHAMEGDNVIVKQRASGQSRTCAECAYLNRSVKARAEAVAAGREYRPYARRAA